MDDKKDYFEAVLIAGVMLLVGSAVLGQPVVVEMSTLAVAAVLGLLSAYRFIKADRPRAGSAARKALIFVGTFAVGIGLDIANKKIAMSRAETIITACRAYKARTGAYPDTLQALVPGYLKAIPRAKYTVLWGKFHYGEGRLAWTVIPMTVMPSFDLNVGEWSFSLQNALPVVLGKGS